MSQVNIPNALTIVRILLVPVLVVALLAKTGAGDVLAAVAFIAASVTDALDGWLARSRNLVTTFGKLMDPIADKLLIIAALLALVSLGRLPAWIGVVIIGREFAVTALRAAVGAGQGVVISASVFGKLKTVCQVVMVLVLIGEHHWLGVARGRSAWWVYLVEYVTVLVTLLSGLDYFRAALVGLRGGDPPASGDLSGSGDRSGSGVEPGAAARVNR